MIDQIRPDDLARFAPAFLVKRMVGNPDALMSSTRDDISGAVLFADISGFTALSERLATRGTDGVEELTQVLNAYFGRLIDIITAYGGDVVKFAGDALLAIFPAHDEADVVRSARAAAACGLQVQREMKSFTAQAGHRLFLRVGVSAGAMSVLNLGGVRKRWEFVLVGQPVIEATMASGQDEPGHVVLGSTARDLPGISARCTAISSEYSRLDEVTGTLSFSPLEKVPLTSQAVPRLLAFIPAAIHLRLAARQSGWLAEMRWLTVLFVNLPGMNQETPIEHSQEVMLALQTELYHFEGSVNKLSTDEKGVTFVAALGLPPLAHEDDAIRGTLAALAIKAKLAKLGWQTSIGVTSGRVFCGTIGSENRCEFTIIGDIVNLSARLMIAANGGILCDETTLKAGLDRLAWEALPPVMLKGKAHLVPNFRPLGPANEAQRPKHSQELIGRVDELKLHEQIIREIFKDRSSRVLLIEGEAGIGKSTLISSILQNAAKKNLKTWLGAALAIERSTPYFAWRAIFRQVFRLDASEPLEAQRQKVFDHLAFDPELNELAPLLDTVLSLDFPPTSKTLEMFGEVRLSQTNSLLVHLLIREVEQAPLQLIVEDCHWLDSASWSLVRAVAEQIPAVILVLVTRPLSDPLPRDYVPVAALKSTHKLALGPLGSDEAIALVKRRLGVVNIPDSMATLLHSKAQGNPFFIEELAYSLRETRKILIQDGRCTIAPGEDLLSLRFPDNVQGVVTSRIDRLAPPEQLTLKVASVIGRTFSKNLLRDISPIEDDKPNLERYLATLNSQSLTMLEAPDPDPAYCFKHVITQEVSYQMMPPAQRKKLHQVVAEWYEQHHGNDLSPFFPLLAKHWSNTDRFTRAIEYLEKSGENAMRDCAHEEAVTFFSQALALDQEIGFQSDRLRRAGWKRQLAEAYYNLSNLGTARQHFQSALEDLGYPFPRTQAGFVVSSIWEFAKQQMHRLRPRWFLGRSAHEAPQRLEAARAYERLVQIHYLNNAKVPSVHAAFKALNLSESVGECAEFARNLSHAAVFSGLLLMHGSARAYAERSRAMAAKVGQQSCIAYVEFIRGVYWVTVGEWDKAVNDLSTCMEMTERNGEQRRWYESGFTLANALSRRGNFRQSLLLSQKIHQLGVRRSIPQVQVWGLSWQLVCHHALAPETAQRDLEAELADVLDTYSQVPLADQILGRGVLALSQWQRGEKAAARQTTEAAEAIIATTNQISHYLPPAYTGLAEVYIGLWQDQTGNPEVVREMDRRLRQLGKILGQFSLMYPIGKPTAYLVKGRYYSMKGWKRSAIRCWQRSLAAAERFQMPYEQSQAHAELARHLPDHDPQSAFHRQRAFELHQQLDS